GRRKIVKLVGTVTVFALACAFVPAQAAVGATADQPTPAEVDAAIAPAAQAVADWREPTESAQAEPADVVDGALKEAGKNPNSTVKVVSVVAKNGKPVIKTQTVKGAAAAKQVVTKVQDDPRLLSVEVD